MGKTALVLSGGALFGAYQAGAWSVLEPELQPDLIAATSVGALNGWAIAGGASGDWLLREWRNPVTARLLARRPGFPGPFGVFDRAGLECTVCDLMREFRPRIPLGVTVVEVPAFVSRLFVGDEITDRHLLATCAVPAGFPPVRIGRRFYIDGGVKSALPIWAAVQMGATRIVAVNALPVPPAAFLRLFGRTLRLLGGAPKPVPAAVEVIRIAPAESLGTLGQAAEWNAGRINTWIEKGRRDASRALNRSTCVAV